jgi:hypothetical protein
MTSTDPAVQEWTEVLRSYRENHSNHDRCDDCDPHTIAEKHLEQCFEALDYSEREDAYEDEVEDPSYGPFCGCSTCVVREVLLSALPALVHQLRHNPLRDALQREWDRR